MNSFLKAFSVLMKLLRPSQFYAPKSNRLSVNNVWLHCLICTAFQIRTPTYTKKMYLFFLCRWSPKWLAF